MSKDQYSLILLLTWYVVILMVSLTICRATKIIILLASLIALMTLVIPILILVIFAFNLLFFFLFKWSLLLCFVFLFVETENYQGWKTLLRSSSPNLNIIVPGPPLSHVPKHHIYMVFVHFQRWWFHHFSGQSVPMLDHSFHEETFSNIQCKHPKHNLKPFPLVLLHVSWEK